MVMRNLIMKTFTFVVVGFAGLFGASRALGADYAIYQVYRQVDLGTSSVPPPQQIFVNMGAEQGVKKGTILDVYRKLSSFDLLTQKHVGDHMLPIGRIKVIHTDDTTAIARIDKFVSADQEIILLPQAVMVGDVVRMTK
jgi:hypothetical protein